MGLDSGNPRGEPGSTEPTTCPAPGAQAPGCLGSFPEICQSCRRQRDRSPLFLAERDFKGLKALSDLNPAMFHSFDPRKSTMPRRTVKSFFTLLCSPISQHFPPPLPGAGAPWGFSLDALLCLVTFTINSGIRKPFGIFQRTGWLGTNIAKYLPGGGQCVRCSYTSTHYSLPSTVK